MTIKEKKQKTNDIFQEYHSKMQLSLQAGTTDNDHYLTLFNNAFSELCDIEQTYTGNANIQCPVILENALLIAERNYLKGIKLT
jgi:hypothetical protein